MSEIPKIARARLAQAAAGGGSHPDADQLTAFVERSLGAREREQVLEHLSRCAQCREIVALALPPEEAVGFAPAQPTSGFRWWEWRTLRWAAVAATFVIAVTLVFQTYYAPRSAVSREAAQNRPMAAPVPAPSEAAKPAEPARAADELQPRQQARAAQGKVPSSSPVVVARDQELAAVNGQSKLDAVTRAKTTQKPAEVAGVSGGRADESGKFGAVGAGTVGGVASGTTAASAPAPAAMAAERKSGPAAPAPPQVAGSAQPVPPPPSATKEETQGQPPAAAATSTAAQRAESVEVTAQNETVTLEKDFAQRARKVSPERSFDVVVPLSKAAASMRWIITSEGRVQRTVDNGRTWKSVALDNHIRFRAITAAGSEMWAGGEGGALYHSSDFGDHWQRVALPRELASATIARLEFTDAGHGTLTTSSGETWATSDSGATWQKK